MDVQWCSPHGMVAEQFEEPGRRIPRGMATDSAGIRSSHLLPAQRSPPYSSSCAAELRLESVAPRGLAAGCGMRDTGSPPLVTNQRSLAAPEPERRARYAHTRVA